jgi:hypothetical protein
LRAALIEHGAAQARRFAWARTARMTMDVYERVHREWTLR